MEPETSLRRPLLVCGMLVGPLYLAVGLAQALVREGFDLGRHSLSALANGPGGWVQTANFLVSGALVVAAAVGIARAMRPRGRVTGVLLGGFGVGMIVAAFFRADPVDGFPVGTPEGFPTTISTAGTIHFAAGALGFLALAAAAIAAAVAMRRRGEGRMAALSLLSGVAIVGGFFAPFLIPASGPVAGIWFSVIVGWAWQAVTCAHLRRGDDPAARRTGPGPGASSVSAARAP